MSDLRSPSPPAVLPLEGSSMLQADAEGWISTRPVRALEVGQRLVLLPALLWRHRDLVSTSVRRELGARFTGTVLGWIWPLVHPLFLFLVYYFIFTKLLQLKLASLPAGQEAALGVFMFVGIMVWAAISESLVRGTNAIVENGNMIKKLAFPAEILPLNVTLVGLVTLVFAVLVFIAGCVFTPMWVAPGWGLLWIPVLLLLQCIFTYGLVLLLGTLHVFLRDTLQVVSVLATVWMFATPLFWVPLTEVMGKGIEPYLPFIRANPLYHLVHAWRGALMGELVVPAHETQHGWVEAVAATSPDFVGPSVLVFAVWAVAAFVVGFAFFVVGQRRFADEV
ncbi:MAG: ABC transporter permease [Planctomycetota bacterium]